MEQKVNVDVNEEKKMPENKHLYFLHNVLNKEAPSYQFCAINNALIVHDSSSQDNLKVNRIDLQVNKSEHTYDISLFCNKVTEDNKEIIVPCGNCEYEDVKKLVEDVVNKKYSASLFINGQEVYNPANGKIDNETTVADNNQVLQAEENPPKVKKNSTDNDTQIAPTLEQKPALPDVKPVQTIVAPQDKKAPIAEPQIATKIEKKDETSNNASKENKTSDAVKKPDLPPKKEEKKEEKKKDKKKKSIPLWGDYLKPLTTLAIKVVTVFLIVAAFIGAFPTTIMAYVIFGALFANIFTDKILEKSEKAVKKIAENVKETKAIIKNDKKLRQCKRSIKKYEKEERRKLAQKKKLASLQNTQSESTNAKIDKSQAMSM